MKNKIRLILETQLCSLIRKNYPDNEGINNRLGAAVDEIFALTDPGPKRKKKEKEIVPKAENITTSKSSYTYGDE